MCFSSGWLHHVQLGARAPPPLSPLSAFPHPSPTFTPTSHRALSTPCGHNGCSECLQEWIARAHRCVPWTGARGGRGGPRLWSAPAHRLTGLLAVALLLLRSCPVCTAPDVTAPKLIKNHAFDSLFQRVSGEREKGRVAVTVVAPHPVCVCARKFVCPGRTSVCCKGQIYVC
jgi:hypothetical protein